MSKWDECKNIVYIVMALVTVAGAGFTSALVFATNERVNGLEARINGIDVQDLKKQLRVLKERYGHTDCARMSASDSQLCYWLKDSITRFGGQPDENL